ncbi:hypothetical protein [Nitrosomonas sp.]|uniref:hypothetical protein n=1 Tax=Nitrosomonas sp. TaxID=42353 RepID=UPI0028421134|nr:hypothetical protein [Nitrosomonas sp.]MDR4513901.1 hypothetical protein [Nitrosomonas sp.]
MKVKGHIVSQTEWYGRYFSLGQYILSGWTPDTQQLSSQTLSIAGNCTKWIDVGWTFKFKPYVEKDKKQPIIGFAEVAEYHDRIPKATCRNQRINNDTCEFGRCNEWNDIFPYRYLIKSKDMALSLFSKIKQEGY